MGDVYLRHNFQIGLRIFANQIYYDISIDALNIQGYVVERKNPQNTQTTKHTQKKRTKTTLFPKSLSLPLYYQ